MKNQQGFSLIEILMALVILGTAGVGFLSGIKTVYETVPVTDQENIALSIAENQMEYIRIQPYEHSGKYKIISNIPPGYSISTPMAGFMDPEDDGYDDDDSLQKITVVVHYKDEPVTALEAFKPDKS